MKRILYQRAVIMIAATALAAIVWPMHWHPTSWQTHAQSPGSVVSVRPLADVADQLESRYATIVTYEEPLLLYRGDLDLFGNSEALRGALGPKMRTFNPPVVSAAKLDLSAIEPVIYAYNRQNDLPSFRVAFSNYGLHITPAEIKDSLGRTMHATSLLDTVISVPLATRSPWQTLEAFCQAVGNAAGIELQASCPSLRPDYDEIFTGGEEQFLTWGVKTSNARNALIDLLGHSATSLSWRLNCQPSAQPSDRFCVLNVSPMLLTIVGKNGASQKKQLLYDRCGRCPKVRRPPPLPPQ